MATENVKMTITADAKAVVSEIGRARGEIEKLRGSLPGLRNNFEGVTVSTNGLIKNLLGVSLAAVGFHQAVEAIKKTVGMSIEYNKTLETSKLGIAAILTSMTDITDAQGRALAGQDKFNASQQIAVEAQKELQKIAMTTPASYRELVEVYQGILAPALSAKMTFKETLEITGLLTNAVKSIGLPINQIKQEARDLIQGGIQPASSSLAIALGISDSMVKKWREQGTVFTELKTRLEGFIYASREFENTWEGAWSNLKDILERAFGEGGSGLFGMLKKGVQEFSRSLVDVQRDADGTITKIDVKPEIIYRLRIAGSIIADMVLSLKEIVKLAAAAADKIPLIGGMVKSSFLMRSWKEVKANVPGVPLPRLNADTLDMLLKRGMSPEEIGKAISGGVIKVAPGPEWGAPMTWDEEELNKFRDRLMGGQAGQYNIKGKPQPVSDEAKKAADNIKKMLRDWQTDAEKGAESSDKWADKLLDVKNKYEDAMQKMGELKGKESDKKLLAGYYESIVSGIGRERTKEAEADWREYTNKLAEQDARIQEEITNKQSSELEKRLAAEDAWAAELGEMLGERGLEAEEFEAQYTEIVRIAEKNKQKIRDDARMQELEARTRHTLAVLDLAEKEMSMSRRDVAAGRLAEYRQVVGYYEKMRLAAIERNDLTGQLTAESKIDETRLKIADLIIEVERLDGTFVGGWQRGLREYTYNLQTTFEYAQQIAKETAQAMQQAFSDFFFDAFEGNLKNLSDYINSFLTSVKRAVASALGQQVTGAITGLFAKQPTGAGSGVAGISGNMFGDWTAGLGFHNGGMPDEPTFYRLIPRFHSGIGPDEVLSIIRKDEGVFTPGQMKALGIGIMANNQAVTPQIHINFKVDNQADAKIEQGESNMRFDGTAWWVDTAIKVMRSKPDMRQLFASGGKS